ncbi:hypothetical protein [Dickeya zeae]|uniref:hypothetical protein n=1 Tax=Dickeya zeae TaxID=204042 RepID=UPI00215DB41B|nr:hypothetical protein [Dickeya zeae]
MKHLIAMSAVSVCLFSGGLASAADVYNNQGNKLDLYGKVITRYVSLGVNDTLFTGLVYQF